jgi:hypothetical protein
MKKCIVLVLLVQGKLFAQIDDTLYQPKPQLNETPALDKKGNIFFDVYRGFFDPVIQSLSIHKGYNVSNNLGLLGVRGEYLINEWIGVGGEVSLKYYEVSFRSVYYTKLPDTTSYQFNIKNHEILIAPNLNFHFFSSKRFQSCLNLKFGYHYSYFGSNRELDYSVNPFPSYQSIFVRFAFNLRYLITQNIGLNFGMSTSKDIFSAGLTIKFH